MGSWFTSIISFFLPYSLPTQKHVSLYGHPLFSPFSVVRPTQIVAIKKRKKEKKKKKKSNGVVKPLLCRIVVSVVYPFSHVVLILQ